ncbi:hypothetical protein HF325_001667 [Metschnikowia pulcherrima]|uniref:Uncharacterized protein n=1 Tax=Metschnikowia pulcherrima TaxID=27326 RepID=A0A8H7GX81_9ASCO|nr:hypothetical protein HF325_001667 [Metschnikowia pulcherrima]
MKRQKFATVPTKVSSLILLNVTINQVTEIQALIDCGATADFIDARLVKELQLEEYTLETAGRTALATKGMTVPITSEVTLEMHCNGTMMRRGFIVYPDLYESMVFGTPFMQDFAGLLNFSTREFNGLPLNNRVPQDLSHAKVMPVTQIGATHLARSCKYKKNDVFTHAIRLNRMMLTTTEIGPARSTLFSFKSSAGRTPILLSFTEFSATRKKFNLNFRNS